MSPLVGPERGFSTLVSIILVFVVVFILVVIVGFLVLFGGSGSPPYAAVLVDVGPDMRVGNGGDYQVVIQIESLSHAEYVDVKSPSYSTVEGVSDLDGDGRPTEAGSIGDVIYVHNLKKGDTVRILAVNGDRRRVVRTVSV